MGLVSLRDDWDDRRIMFHVVLRCGRDAFGSEGHVESFLLGSVMGERFASLPGSEVVVEKRLDLLEEPVTGVSTFPG